MIGRICNLLERVSYYLSGFALLLLSLVMLSEVIFRYIPWLAYAQPWVPDMLGLLNTWVIFLGSVVAMGRDQHLRISFLAERLPIQMREWNNMVVNLISLFLLLLVIYYSIPICRTGMSLIAAGVPFSKGYTFLALPICTSAMSLVVIRRIIESIKKVRLRNAS